MDTQQRIDAIKTGLAALDTAIGQTEAAMRMAATPDVVRSVSSTLVSLRSERSRLQAQLNNLEAASVEVQVPGSAAKVAALQSSLDAALTDRSVVNATLKFAERVHHDAKTLRMSGDDPTPPVIKARPRRTTI